MYIPKHFAIEETAACLQVIVENGFGELVTEDDTGLPFASHLPFLIDAARGARGTLIGHMARANPQWRHFANGKPALAIFRGAHAYISPAWYASLPAVPTWNYIAVHAYGVPQIVDAPVAMEVVTRRIRRGLPRRSPPPVIHPPKRRLELCNAERVRQGSARRAYWTETTRSSRALRST